MFIQRPTIKRLTAVEATRILSCDSVPVEKDLHVRLMLGELSVMAFSSADIVAILGEDFRQRLEASSVSWRAGAALMQGQISSTTTAVTVPYYVVLDVEALRQIIPKRPLTGEKTTHARQPMARVVPTLRH